MFSKPRQTIYVRRQKKVINTMKNKSFLKRIPEKKEKSFFREIFKYLQKSSLWQEKKCLNFLFQNSSFDNEMQINIPQYLFFFEFFVDFKRKQFFRENILSRKQIEIGFQSIQYERQTIKMVRYLKIYVFAIHLI